MAVNCCKSLEMARKAGNGSEWLDWLEMAGIGWTQLKIARIIIIRNKSFDFLHF